MRANHEHCRESNERSEIDQHKGDRKSGLDQEILKIMLWKIGWICMSCMPDVPFEKEGISSKLDKVKKEEWKYAFEMVKKIKMGKKMKTPGLVS